MDRVEDLRKPTFLVVGTNEDSCLRRTNFRLIDSLPRTRGGSLILFARGRRETWRLHQSVPLKSDSVTETRVWKTAPTSSRALCLRRTALAKSFGMLVQGASTAV